MKKLFIALLIVLFTGGIACADCTLTFAWTNPSDLDLAGVRIFHHVEGGSYNYATPIWEGTGEESDPISGFTDTGAHNFVARVFDTEGFESVDSNELLFIGPNHPSTGTGPGTITGFGITDWECAP